MGCNSFKYSDTCGISLFATCVKVEQTFPSISSLEGESCTDLDSVLTDIYELIDKSYVDMSVYAKGCLNYSPTADADITPVQVLNKLTSELCTLKSTVAAIDTVDVNTLDLTCLGPVDTCGEIIAVANLQELLQLLINEVCALKNA